MPTPDLRPKLNADLAELVELCAALPSWAVPGVAAVVAEALRHTRCTQRATLAEIATRGSVTPDELAAYLAADAAGKHVLPEELGG